MRRQLVALHVIVGHGGLSLGTGVVNAIGDVVARCQVGVSRLLALRFLAIPVCSFVPNRL
jgi:hypothetical protein